MLDPQGLFALPDLPGPPERVVSLVPSLTESLFTLGFGASVVGVTDYCVAPADKTKSLPKVGGPKDADIEAIKGLDPDLVFVNQEENTQGVVSDLVAAGIPVWMSFPKTVDQAVDVLRKILAIYHDDKPAMHINSLQAAIDMAYAARPEEGLKYFCPIWMDARGDLPWWMTFNQDTFAHSILDLMGGQNIFAGRERVYPLSADIGGDPPMDEPARDTRYPRVVVEEILAGEPALIILPSEPFEFSAHDLPQIEELLAFTPAAQNKNIKLVDGSLITWHGVRMGRALQDLPELFF
jgi:ABC-type Fe3+-hydroxamate transport system substrate-binding protein